MFCGILFFYPYNLLIINYIYIVIYKYIKEARKLIPS